jgi:hypothetical protein
MGDEPTWKESAAGPNRAKNLGNKLPDGEGQPPAELTQPCALNSRIADNKGAIHEQLALIQHNQGRILELEGFLGLTMGGHVTQASFEGLMKEWDERHRAELNKWRKIQRRLKKEAKALKKEIDGQN